MSGTCSSWRSVSQPGPGRALVVNDDFLFLDSLREVVVAAGFEVHCAAGPPEAMRLLERYRYDAVITAMGFAAFGLLPPLDGALLQEGIDVAVILNALRARV